MPKAGFRRNRGRDQKLRAIRLPSTKIRRRSAVSSEIRRSRNQNTVSAYQSFMIQFSLDDKRQSRNWNRKKGNVLILPTPKSALMTRSTTPTLVKTNLDENFMA